MVDAVSEAMKPIVANMTNPARNAVHVSNIDIITASLYDQTSIQRHITVSNIDIITASLYDQTSIQCHITVSATHLSTPTQHIPPPTPNCAKMPHNHLLTYCGIDQGCSLGLEGSTSQSRLGLEDITSWSLHQFKVETYFCYNIHNGRDFFWQ